MKKIIVLSFIEGACVLAVELIGAKMMAPYYGSSLYVWATVLAITLFALTTGYFVGGLLSEKENPECKLYYVTLAGGAFMILMPQLCYLLFHLFGSWRLIPATLLTAGILLFPPVFLMGMVSPLIITVLSPYFHKPGKVAGLVYAVSTLGGIVSTFLSGFYLIPNFGLRLPCISFGITLMLIPIFSLFKKKKSTAIASVVFVTSYLALQKGPLPKAEKRLKVLTIKEGILGQLMVLDCLMPTDTGQWQGRILAVNRIIQTAEDNRPGHYRYLNYIREIEKVIDSLGLKGGNVTIHGLGGGSLARLLNKRGFTVKAIEFDRRMIDASKAYFGLPSTVKTVVDDARHYLNQETEKQTLVIFDIFKGEENPGHVLTLESFKKLCTLLDTNGIFIINTHGYLSGLNGKGNWSLVKTIKASGFNCFILPVEKKVRAEDFRNILIIGAKSRKVFERISSSFKNDLVHIDNKFLSEAIILTDDKPVLDFLNARAARLWRHHYILDVVRYFNYLGVPVFE